SIDVVINIVLTEGSDKNHYQTALNSVECYAALHGYQLRIEFDSKFKECSRHRDKFFRRHCHTHFLMQRELPENAIVLFIDADVGVVNPNKLIEEFLEPDFDIYLYNRFYNWEFAAQYLIKNNERGRKWIKRWADMEFTLPDSVHGTDNGALHILMMHYLAPDSTNSRLGRMCKTIWEHSRDAWDLFGTQACTRVVIGERNEFHDHHVKIFAKGAGWARDAWLLKSHWSDEDFMLHSIKDERLRAEDVLEESHGHNLVKTTDRLGYPLSFPVIERLNISHCATGEVRWTMDRRLRISNTLRAREFGRLTTLKLKEQ
ncbi:hypothetical protein PENTCL1PPCAC_29826, partial [Pristionchus entomophagus]